MIKPLVSIVIATYFPEQDFFIKQLKSVNNQSYENIEVIIRDDSADIEQYRVVESLVKRHIIKYPYKIQRNTVNLGSNKTFELLTEAASGEYLSYCDQDDIWYPFKVEKLVEMAIRENHTLVYSDLSLIDSNDQMLSKSFKKSNFRLKHVYGLNIFRYLVNRNSVTGCSLLVKKEIAKRAIPFPNSDLYVHDHWLAINASLAGSIGYSKIPLVLYRIHSGNQIGSSRLANIDNTDDYCFWRLQKQLERYEILKKLPLNNEQFEIVESCIRGIVQRDHFSKEKTLISAIKLMYYYRYDIVLAIFEILLFTLPGPVANKLLQKIKK